MYYYGNNDYRDYLAHFGVKGMKWGKHLFGEDKNQFHSETTAGVYKNLKRSADDAVNRAIYMTKITGDRNSKDAKSAWQMAGISKKYADNYYTDMTSSKKNAYGKAIRNAQIMRLQYKPMAEELGLNGHVRGFLKDAAYYRSKANKARKEYEATPSYKLNQLKKTASKTISKGAKAVTKILSSAAKKVSSVASAVVKKGTSFVSSLFNRQKKITTSAPTTARGLKNYQENSRARASINYRTAANRARKTGKAAQVSRNIKRARIVESRAWG